MSNYYEQSEAPHYTCLTCGWSGIELDNDGDPGGSLSFCPQCGEVESDRLECEYIPI